LSAGMKGSGGGAPPSSRLARRRRGYQVLSYSNQSAYSMNKTNKNPTRFAMEGLLPGPDIEPWVFVRVGLVLATGPGNPPAVRFLAGGSVRFGSRPVQKTELRCIGGVETRTGHKPAVFWPGISCSRASFSRT